MKIVGIVGWKDSGKTTIATKIINKLSSKNFRVASIKHAHHEFDIDHENTDSFKHRSAGSSQVIVSSSKRWVKISELNNSKEKTLNELINQLSEIDIVIVEGFKNENHPKIEIIKNDNVNYLFNKIKNIKAIITNNILETDLKIFKNDEIDNIVDYILREFLMNKSPLTKKQIVNLFKKQKIVICNSEKVNLENSEDRFLYENIKSKINLPPFNNSAVDGYAILKADLKTKKIFFCNRRIAAGDNKNIKVKPGEAIRIFTGAKMPMNSSTIVMQENTYKRGNKIHLIKIPKSGENFRLKGEDVKKNQKILEKGSKLNQQNINLIAATGTSKIKVFKKIKIGFFTSGNELRKPTNNLKNSEINNSNYYSLNNLLDKNFIKKKYCGNLKDNFKFIKNKIFNTSKKFNIIITAGGASVGDEDHLIKVLSELGKVYFWRAAIKPGRPIAFGKINKCYIICLPGNPVSVQLLYAMLVKPLIEKLSGGNFRLPFSSKIIANFSMKKKTKRMEWLRVNKETINNKNIANKFPKQGSGMISSISYSDGIIEIDENVSQVNKGDIFDFYNYESLF